jgi:hypothetical protein
LGILKYISQIFLYFSCVSVISCFNIAEIAKRMVHLITVSNTAFLCTDEVARLFTDFSGRHVILKILESKGIVIPFHEIGWKDVPVIIEALGA